MNGLTLSKGPVSLRPLSREDAPLLLKWLTDPRVLEWYEGRDHTFTPELILEHFYPEEDPLCRSVIQWEGRDVGYVQCYPLDREGLEEYKYPYPERNPFAADQFLGEPDCWGKGIGRAFLSLLVEYLTRTCSAGAVLLDPHVNNLRAIRCYEACGFQKLKLLPAHELHEGVWEDCWLMEYRSPGR